MLKSRLLNLLKPLGDEYLPIFFLIILLNLFTYLLIDIKIEHTDSLILDLLLGISSIYVSTNIVFILFRFFGDKIFRILIKFLFLISVLFLFLQIFLVFKTNIAYSFVAIDALTQTTKNEALEFAITHYDCRILLSYLLIILFCIIFLRIRFIGKYFIYEKLSLFSALIFSINLVYASFTTFIAYQKVMLELNKVPLFNLVYTTYQYKKLNLQDIREINALQKQIFDLHTHKTARNKIKNVVFIIGESLQRDFMQLYGYDKKNNPNLKILKDRGNLVAFNDTISPWPSTAQSLKVVLSFGNYENGQSRKWYENLTIVDLAKLSNYFTVWISNQEGFEDVKPVNIIAKRADYKAFVARIPTMSYIDYYYDGKVLPMIEDIKNSRSSDMFYFIHLLGNHQDYSRRYPSEFTKFDKKDIVNSKLDDKNRQYVGEYLNSILYNDYIINEIYKIFQNDNALIIYLSDHGEDLWQTNLNSYGGHGYICRFTAEIPLIFIATDKFRLENAEIWRKIVLAKDKPFMSDDLIHSVVEILDMESLSEFDATRSVINENFNSRRKRMIENIDYDEKLKDQSDFSR